MQLRVLSWPVLLLYRRLCCALVWACKVRVCVKKYNFTAARGGNSNKMRNFVS